MFRTGLRIVLFALATLLASAAGAGDRVALVVGIGKYAHATPLPNPANDANTIAGELKSLGFEVIQGLDLDKAGFDGKVREFAEKSYDAKVALFFYAGHGVQANGRNYLIPTDAILETFTALDFEAVELDTVLKYTAGEGRISLAFIDACRDNPFTRSLGRGFDRGGGAAGQGLAMPQMSLGGMLIAYATSPGATAADGKGDHSPFTQALMTQMATPGLEVQQMMTRVKAEVYDTTDGQQEPWHNSSLRNEYYFVPAVQQALVVPAVPAEAPAIVPTEVADANVAADELLWRQIGGSTDVAKLRLFMATFPESIYLKEARQQVANLMENTRYDQFVMRFDGRFSGEAEQFVVVADGTLGRDTPDLYGSSKIALKSGDRVRSFAKLPEKFADWVPIKTVDGTAAFVLRADLKLLSEVLEEERRNSEAGRSIADLDALFDRIVAANGPLSEINGTWNPGVCVADEANGFALAYTWIVWSEKEGELLLSHPGTPSEIQVGTLDRYKKIKLNSAGTVQFYKWAFPDGTTNIVGLKGDDLFYPKNDAETEFGSYKRCGSGDEDRQLLAKWLEKSASK